MSPKHADKGDYPPIVYVSQLDRESRERARSDRRSLAGCLFGSALVAALLFKGACDMVKTLQERDKPKSPEEIALTRKHSLQGWMKQNKELVSFVQNSEQLKTDIKELKQEFGDNLYPKIKASSMWKIAGSLLSCKSSLMWVKENDVTFKQYPQKSDQLINDIDSMTKKIIEQSGGRRSQLSIIFAQATPMMQSEDYFQRYTRTFGESLPPPQQTYEFKSSKDIDFSMLSDIVYRVEKSAGVATDKRYRDVMFELEETSKN